MNFRILAKGRYGSELRNVTSSSIISIGSEGRGHLKNPWEGWKPPGIYLRKKARLLVVMRKITWPQEKSHLHTSVSFHHCFIYFKLSTGKNHSERKERWVCTDAPKAVKLSKLLGH